jgi:hypothetical protein
MFVTAVSYQIQSGGVSMTLVDAIVKLPKSAWNMTSLSATVMRRKHWARFNKYFILKHENAMF